MFRAWRSLGVETGIEGARTDIAACFDTADQSEAMSTFLDGREPAFDGR